MRSAARYPALHMSFMSLDLDTLTHFPSVSISNSLSAADFATVDKRVLKLAESVTVANFEDRSRGLDIRKLFYAD